MMIMTTMTKIDGPLTLHIYQGISGAQVESNKHILEDHLGLKWGSNLLVPPSCMVGESSNLNVIIVEIH